LDLISTLVHQFTPHLTYSLFFFLTIPPPPRSTLFPYTTLFRSADRLPDRRASAIRSQKGRGVSRPHHHQAQQQSSRAVEGDGHPDRKSTRLNSSHLGISYAVFCLKKKKKTNNLRIYDIKIKSST